MSTTGGVVRRAFLHEGARHVEAAFLTEVDVDEGDVGRQLIRQPNRLGAGGRDGDHLQTLPLKQVAGSPEEVAVVVDDQNT